MVTDRSCNNKLVTTELVVQCRKSQVTYGITGMKNLQKRKVRSKNKVRDLFPQNKVRFTRAGQVRYSHEQTLMLIDCQFTNQYVNAQITTTGNYSQN